MKAEILRSGNILVWALRSLKYVLSWRVTPEEMCGRKSNHRMRQKARPTQRATTHLARTKHGPTKNHINPTPFEVIS